MPRVLVLPADNAGCGNYRLRFPAQALIDQGANVRIDDTRGLVMLWSERWDGPEPPDHVSVVGVYPPPADVVVMQRPARRYWAEAIPHLQSHGIRVVVDMDDRLDRLHRDHVAWASHQKSYRWASEACKAADLVTVTTPALLGVYGNGHGVVLPNLVPASYLHIDHAKADRFVGWSGEVTTHTGDLETAGDVVGQTQRAHRWMLRTVGTGDGVPERLGVRSEHASCTGWSPIDQYPRRLAELDVGLVPLANTAFNRAKSALKMMEMAAVGVPAVVSPTPDNKRMHALGIGRVAEGPEQWSTHLGQLMASKEMRADLAGIGRRVMVDHTYEKRCGRWWDAWTSVTVARSAA